MRAFLVGLFILTICGSASGQAVGFVEQIGFGKRVRPYGWTPIRVNLTSQIGEPAKYQIQVRQEDLDRDRVIFRRDIVLNARNERNDGERFWVYFMAQPRGLGAGTPGDLNKLLDVRLCTESGKPLFKLNIQDSILPVDPPRQGFGATRGKQVVLMVTDGSGSRSTPAVSEWQGAIGLNEDVDSVLVTPFDLPENVIGYDAVDAIVWLDADAGKMTTGGSKRLAAMTEYVREGGRLVVCQPGERFKIEPLADLLPVNTHDEAGDWIIPLRDKANLDPIPRLAAYHSNDSGSDQLREFQRSGWTLVEKRGPFKVAFAQLRDDAVGEEWIDWSPKGDWSKEVSPWLARRAVGFGSVTWVAQDLGNPIITGVNSSGWPYVWDTILGQRNSDMRVLRETDGRAPYAEKAQERYQTTSSIDLGSSMLRGMEHEGRAGGLVFLAGVFFVGYWVIAGPVSYVVLAGKKRTELSWTIFAVSALVATLLTVGVVRLVLRGDAEVHHVSLVRMIPAGRAADGTPQSRALVNSRIGLYIPRDDKQRVTLLENDKEAVSYVTPFSIHPDHQGSSTDFPAYLEYEIPVRDNPLTDPITALFPYRSTLKKLQARWVGNLGGGIDVSGSATGKLRLLAGDKVDATGAKSQYEYGTIAGKLTNRAGTDLAHVYFVYHFPPQYQGSFEKDFVLYAPSWPAGQTIDLEAQFNGAAKLLVPGSPGTNTKTQPGGTNKRWIRGMLDDEWSKFWYYSLRPSNLGDQFDDSRSEFLRSFPMLSLYHRIAPNENEANTPERVEVLRRAAREWDASEIVGAGQLLILAQGGQPGTTANLNPLPFKMEVEGDLVAGTGTTFYQFALPLDRSTLPKPYLPPDAGDETPTKPPTAPKAAG